MSFRNRPQQSLSISAIITNTKNPESKCVEMPMKRDSHLRVQATERLTERGELK